VNVAYQTRAGRKRALNEDSLFVDKDLGLFIVADGMGGHNAGEIASSIVVTEMSNTIREGLESDKQAPVVLEESVRKAHSAILENSMKHRDRGDMGTTVVAVLVGGDRAWICHVGDSRAYLVGNGRIQPLTRDHTLVAEWLEQGHITAEQARTHQARHGLTMALGVDDEVHPEVGEVIWRDGQCLLLCSDGLTQMLEDRAILQIIQTSGDPDAACKELAAKAEHMGGFDDITAILICR
jgi:protein phosphatase